MSKVLSYQEFLTEKVDLSQPVNPGITLNYADETMEGLRRKLLDKYMPMAKDKNGEKAINSCITTYVYALDKKLKIDEDIVKELAERIGKTHKETSKELAKETTGYYDDFENVIQ